MRAQNKSSPAPSFAPADIAGLFNQMARTYGSVNLLSSFGFSHLWRRACVKALGVGPGHICADLMCGMGEASWLMIREAGGNLHLEAFDFSTEMTLRFRQNLSHLRTTHSAVYTRDVFDLVRESKYDRICCSFGLKTLDDEHLRRFAGLIRDLLTTDGKAAFVEISVPASKLLRWPYLLYIRHVIPLIGYLCMGNPDCYRYLARYTEDFAGRDQLEVYLREAGLRTSRRSLFFGCARMYVAHRDGVNSAGSSTAGG